MILFLPKRRDSRSRSRSPIRDADDYRLEDPPGPSRFDPTREERSPTRGEQIPEGFGIPINERQYDEMGNDEFLKHACSVVTTVEHFKGLFRYMKQRKMVPDFLANGEMVVVRKIIVETRLLEG